MTPQELMAAADAAYDAGRFGLAARTYARLAGVAPFHPMPLFNMAAALRDGGDRAAAETWFRRAAAAAAAQPEQVEQASAAAAGCALALGRTAAAVELAAQAVAAAPQSAQRRQELADAVKTTGDDDRAAALYRRALTLDPARGAAWFNLGVTLGDAGARPDEAAQAAARAAAIDPTDARARFNLAWELLASGRLREGFAAFEGRFNGVVARPTTPLPWWAGESLVGKRVLLFAEQGHGDGIQFARYATAVARAGAASVGVEAPPAVVRLLASVPGVARVHPAGAAPVDEYDLFCPLMSLPHLFAADVGSIPAAVPYVADRFPGDEKLERWFPAGDDRFRVGLVWSGEARRRDPRQFAANLRRSLTPERAAPLLDVPGVVFYSLQWGEDRAALQAPPFAGRLIDPMDDVSDMADTAGLIRRLDLVISVCTAAAHLAGAMGKPTWIPLAQRPCWRWMRDRDDSPWYPGVRLFRQIRPGDWEPVVRRMAAALAEKTLTKKTPAEKTPAEKTGR